jgi:exonuclease III
MAYITETIKNYKPDVVCFQEVLPEYARELTQLMTRTEEGYASSDDGTGSSVGYYGTLMLVRRSHFPTFTRTSFGEYTSMDRDLLSADLGAMSKNPLVVGTVHLESLNSHPYRVKQMRCCYEKLCQSRPHTSAILCGDFNFCSYAQFTDWQPQPSMPSFGRPRKVRRSIFHNDDDDDDDGDESAQQQLRVLDNDDLERELPGFVDLWPALRPEHSPHQQPHQHGYTFDSDNNSNIHEHLRMRLDRVLLRNVFSSTNNPPTSITSSSSSSKNNQNNSAGWRAVSIDMVGTKPIPDGIVTESESISASNSVPEIPSKSRMRNPSGGPGTPVARHDESADVGSVELPISTPQKSDTPCEVFASDHYGLFVTFESLEKTE